MRNYGITNESLSPERLKGLLGTGIMQPKVRIVAYAPCKLKAHRERTKRTHEPCGCKKEITGIREGIANLCTNVFAAFVQAQILNQAPANNQTDTGGTGRAITANSAMSALTGEGGTGGTTAAVTDTKLTTATESQAATVNANPTTGTTSGTFTVTFTLTAGADRVYIEVGLYVTKQTWVFCICRDSFAALNVSNTGTLAVTYTFTNS